MEAEQLLIVERYLDDSVGLGVSEDCTFALESNDLYERSVGAQPFVGLHEACKDMTGEGRDAFVFLLGSRLDLLIDLFRHVNRPETLVWHICRRSVAVI